MIAEDQIIRRSTHLWLLVGVSSFFYLMYLPQLPAVNSVLIQVLVGILVVGWVLILAVANHFYGPRCGSARSYIGGVKKTALEMACLQAAFWTRRVYDPYKLLLSTSVMLVDTPCYMRYYMFLVLGTCQVYSYPQIFALASDLGFGNFWSVILMESLIYWMPTDMTVLLALVFCSAAAARNNYFRRCKSLIPEALASVLVLALAVAILPVWPAWPLGSIKVDEENLAERLRLEEELCTCLSSTLMTTLAMEWLYNYMPICDDDDSATTRREEKKQQQVEPPTAPASLHLPATLQPKRNQQQLTKRRSTTSVNACACKCVNCVQYCVGR